MQAGGVFCRGESPPAPELLPGGSRQAVSAVHWTSGFESPDDLLTTRHAVAIPFINEIAFPDGVATVCKWGYYSRHDTSIFAIVRAQDYNHIRQSGLPGNE